MLEHLWLRRILAARAAAFAALSLVPPSALAAAPVAPIETVLYSFCAEGGLNCTDGAGPNSGLIMDRAGRLYGTTSNGGACIASAGSVFELAPDPSRTIWTKTLLYSFGGACAAGFEPFAGLFMDSAGNLYGTTQSGGAHQNGTVFKLTHNATRTAWTGTVLYSFCARGGSACTDGSQPLAGVSMDAAGRLYGTTSVGGAHGGGTVFELVPNATGTAWTETVLYSFCAEGGSSCTDGRSPQAGVLIDSAGRLYGTTFDGGAQAAPKTNFFTFAGTVFELIPNAAKTKWTERVLYSFCAERFCTDGNSPNSRLIMDAAGRLYGTALYGGAGGYLGNGTAFELTPDAARTKWTMTVLHRFCGLPGCADGYRPGGAVFEGEAAGLLMDKQGNLYGTTSQGGAGSSGTVFELTPNAARTTWAATVLYSFCALGGVDCTDGSDAQAGLVMDRAGHLYGTTETGGAHNTRGWDAFNGSILNGGTVFELQ